MQPPRLKPVPAKPRRRAPLWLLLIMAPMVSTASAFALYPFIGYWCMLTGVVVDHAARVFTRRARSNERSLAG